MESLLWISCIRFSLQLMVSEAAFLIHRPRRERFALRLTAALAVYFIAASGWYTLLHQIPGDYPAVFVAYYLGLFMLSLGGIRLCFELGRMELIFVGTGGYAAEHMAFALCEIIQYATGWTEARLGPFWHSLVFRFLAYLIGAGLVYLLLVRRNRDKEDFKPHDSRITMLALVTLMAAIVLSVFYSSGSFMEQGTVASEMVCPLYSTLCCLLVLLMEFYVLRENRMKREQEVMEQLLQMANAQRKSAQESIDIINMKCHDLKHQISALARTRDEAARSEYVAEIQQAVSIYEADYHTGCEALDYVLREKALISNQHHVTFSCMADGEAIAFLHPADVYALMGNALDNALNRVLQEPEEQRIISLQIKGVGDMVLLHLENRCNQPPEFQDGLPVTSQEDKSAHGFGMKSIRYLVEKYCGELSIQAREGKFCLDILFPKQAAGGVS